MTETEDLSSWEDHLDRKYGKMGSSTRDKYEKDFAIFLKKAIAEGIASGTAHNSDPKKNLAELRSKQRRR